MPTISQKLITLLRLLYDIYIPSPFEIAASNSIVAFHNGVELVSLRFKNKKKSRNYKVIY